MKRNHILGVGKPEVGATVLAVEWAHDYSLGEIGLTYRPSNELYSSASKSADSFGHRFTGGYCLCKKTNNCYG